MMTTYDIIIMWLALWKGVSIISPGSGFLQLIVKCYGYISTKFQGSISQVMHRFAIVKATVYDPFSQSQPHIPNYAVRIKIKVSIKAEGSCRVSQSPYMFRFKKWKKWWT